MKRKILKMKIIYEDEDIIVVDKPSGLITIKDEKTPVEATLYHQVYEYVKKQNGRIFIVHRLDKDTSGLVIFAKNAEMKTLLQKQFEEQKVVRKYEALVEGKIKKEKDRLKVYLITDKFNNVFATNKNKNGQLAITDYRLISSNDEKSYVDISILTGKRNQIRASFALIGHPIVGDKKYGSTIKKGLSLRAYELLFDDNLNLKKKQFTINKYFDKII